MERSIVERFARQVAAGPDRLAVRSRAHAITYEALDRAANRVAHAILARGGSAAEPIALVAPLGLSAIVSILGALKAGRLYVPVDAAQPPGWVASILDDARPSLVLADRASRAVVAALGLDACRIIDVDPQRCDPSDRDPAVALSPDSLAYILYTSGSTGRPKGAVHDHRHVLCQTRTYTEALGIDAADCLTLLHSHAFSASRLDIFPALLNGAALMPFAAATTGFDVLAREMVEQEVTVWQWIPSAFVHFAAALSGSERFPRLRWVVLGSEAVTRRHVDLYRRHFVPGASLLNRYGTSETGSIAWRAIDAWTDVGEDPVSLGQPVVDADVLILDAAGRELPRGRAGEIAIRSRLNSAGYWRQPDLTAAGFVPDPAPVAPATGGRIYLTGDLGRLSSDGELTHLGRRDFQVKVRGHRVELGEIERVLQEHAGIEEAAVTVRQEAGEAWLVAYVVGTRTPAPAPTALRKFMEARLPQYMIPRAFVPLPAMPRTAGGKIDRRALPARPAGAPCDDGDTTAPRGPLEEALARIWSEVLGVSRVGAHDSFLDLGGDSLHAARIVARVLAVYGVALPLRSLFESPTIAAMAESVSAARAGAPAAPAR